MDTHQHPHIDLAVRYHDAVAAGASGEELARFFTPDAVHRELPNLLFPDGAVRDVAGLCEAAERGLRRLSGQRFEVLDAVASDDRVALEVRWEGVLAEAMGPLPAGHVLRAHIATFLEIRDGRIAAQRNYDCYEPLRAAGESAGGAPAV
ncbi:nuclear transport factor 2 family protein [Streptacidiphilus sp. ASG 303]|uniref:nuclear transport factor 2 family protein n=1 Tax=Streptacidiphilus sp. ASG 303 TaxID=2896847 RepID=UPI001E58ED4C|nr:nuclear transport factor 2 family protein [Streptacidiphilus sp. ASG 303]MCD0483683.1 nuclear transport factor 2 family protein [Streptacidiphilus sp. ASG 303]